MHRLRLKSRWLLLALLVGLPSSLYFVLAERASWRPRTLKIDSSKDGVGDIALSFLPDNQTLIVQFLHPSARARRGEYVDKVQLWNTRRATLSQETAFSAYNPLIDSLIVNPQTGIIAYAEQERITLWNSFNGHCIGRLPQGMPHSISLNINFAPDGKTLAESRDYACAADFGWMDCKSNQINLWDTATRTLKRQLPASHLSNETAMPDLQFSPDGILVAQRRASNLQVWDFRTAHLLWKSQVAFRFSDATFSPDSKTLAILSDSVIRLCDARTGRFLKALPKLTSDEASLSYSPDGKLLITQPSSESIAFQIWDITTGRLLRSPSQNVWNWEGPFQFSPDSRTLAVRHGRVVELQESGSGVVQRRLTGFKGDVTALAFSRDGSTLAAGSDDGTVKLWRIR